MRYAARRVDIDAPVAALPIGQRTCTPGERRLLGRESAIRALRIFHLRTNELPALVERTELFAEAVNGLRIGSDAQPKNSGTVTRHFEKIAGRCRERHA